MSGPTSSFSGNRLFAGGPDADEGDVRFGRDSGHTKSEEIQLDDFPPLHRAVYLGKCGGSRHTACHITSRQTNRHKKTMAWLGWHAGMANACMNARSCTLHADYGQRSSLLPALPAGDDALVRQLLAANHNVNDAVTLQNLAGRYVHRVSKQLHLWGCFQEDALARAHAQCAACA